MQPKIEQTIRVLFSAIQTGKIYAIDHPKFTEITDQAFKTLQEVFSDVKELVIGIVEEELAWEGHIFFELSKKLKSVVYYLMDRNIERITILPALSREELGKFISLLSSAKGEFQKDADRLLNLQGIRNIRTGKIKDASIYDLKCADDWDMLRRFYENSVNTAKETLAKVITGEHIESLDLRFEMQNMLELFMGKHQELMSLVSIKQKDMITFVHLCNVAILSMHLGSRLGFSKDDILNIGMASLFHDIGKIAISSRILTKKSKLDSEEFQKIRRHPLIGAKILTKYVDSLGIIPVIVAFEHHRRYDLNGYPRVDYPKKPHVVSLIVSLCDVYDALAQKRTYKEDYPPNKIYDIMMEESGKLFDPELLEKFFQSMGVWPIGTVVALNDQRIAVVREINDQDIFRPKVEIIEGADKGDFLDLAEQKDGIHIEKALNPFDEGKKYISCI